MLAFYDIVQRLIKVCQGHGIAVPLDTIVSACQSAYLNMAATANWTRYQSRWAAQVYAPVSGRADISGHVITLRDGTWPSWARNCTIYIMGINMQIDKVLSGTEAVVGEQWPGLNGTDQYYRLFHDFVELPSNIIALTSINMDTGTPLLPMSVKRLGELMAQAGYNIGVPSYFAFEAPGGVRGVRLFPLPGGAIKLHGTYKRAPKPILFTGRRAEEHAGTVTVNGTSVTGSDTFWHAGMVGALIRISANSDLPTGHEGSNYYAAEGEITRVNSASSLETDRDLGQFTDAPYVITSPLDVDDYMYQFLVDLACEELAIMTGKSIPTNVELSRQLAIATDRPQVDITPLEPRSLWRHFNYWFSGPQG